MKSTNATAEVRNSFPDVSGKGSTPRSHLPGPLYAAGAEPAPLIAIAQKRRRGRLLFSMSRERAIAVSVAAALHLGGIFVFNGKAKPKPVAHVGPPDTIELMEMPPLDPPDPIEVVATDVAEAPTELAPPMQLDIPSAVAVSAFLQPIKPMLDPRLTGVGALTIPSMTSQMSSTTPIRLFELNELDRVPRRLRTVTPIYPFDMRRAHVEGEVVLLVIIDPQGHVRVDRVMSSTGREFETAAVVAAEQCVFESPVKGGQRVSATYSMRVPFHLQ